MPEFSRLDIHEGWAEIVIERPDRRNSLIPPLAGEIASHVKQLDEDNSISAIVLRGEGGYFCSGIDLKALQADPPPPWKEKDVGDVRSMHIALYHCRKPIIAALEKFAINAGASLAFACDLIVAGESAFLQIGEIQQGANIPMNAAWLKIKTTEFQAARLAFLGDRVKAPELLKRGLISEYVTDDKVVERCTEIATTIAGYPAGAAIAIKQSLIAQRGIDSPEDYFPSTANNALSTAKMLKD
ncbi:MAG: enoyl-CoA hydratase/isomerase family protein [Candidatus Azotimanducaceae bacterium WSBS_2022_MAG_OTU7]